MSKRGRTLELLREGPVTLDDVPADRVMVHRRKVDIRKLNPTAGTNGTHSTGGGAPTQVYYLPDHDRREVIETFLDANKEWVEGLGEPSAYRRILFRLDSSWKPFVRGAWEERGWQHALNPDSNHGGSGKSPGTCPFCGEDYPLSFPNHRRNDCEGGDDDG